MMVFASILPISVRYNADIRTYIWISLFMLLAYLEFYDILENTEGEHLKWFAIYSLLAAYTHYYSTIAIGILCLILLLVYRKDAGLKDSQSNPCIQLVDFIAGASHAKCEHDDKMLEILGEKISVARRH